MWKKVKRYGKTIGKYFLWYDRQYKEWYYRYKTDDIIADEVGGYSTKKKAIKAAIADIKLNS